MATNLPSAFNSNPPVAPSTMLQAFKDLYSFLSGLFGTDGTKATAISTLGVLPNVNPSYTGTLTGNITSSAWGTGLAPLQLKGGSVVSLATTDIKMVENAYYDGTNWKYIATGTASMYAQSAGGHIWYTAVSGTAGNNITWTTDMSLDASGNLNVGNTTNSWHTFVKNTAEASILLSAQSPTVISGAFQVVANDSYNSANAALKLGKNTSTSRSINAAGTINASGADYAEYERNNGLSISKGQIVGFKADGTLTDRYSESIRFAIKSTNPSYVGGDTWGTEEIVGKKPEQPTRKLDTTEQKLVSEATEEAEAVYVTIIIEAGDTDAEWEAIEAQYKADLAEFEARLETERAKVDRIAYSGKVPVNVTGATAGQYIVATVGDGDSIVGVAINKADMTFAKYQDAVGRVNRILDDGRAEVAVVIH